MATEPQTAFFSYSRDDSEFALRLAEDLKAAGASVWLDQLDIAPGQRWARAVQDALNSCQRLLVILSPSSVNSTNVEDEVAFALEEHKTVIPVLYRECKVPFQLRPFQRVDFTADYDRGLKTLLKALGVGQQATSADGGVVSVALDLYEHMRPAERARLEKERKQAEQARLEQEEREHDAAGRARLEEERKQLFEAETARVVAEAERNRREEAETARLAALAEAERKQRDTEAARLAQAEAQRKEAAEQSRLEAEREQAAEQARLEQEREQAAEQARLREEERQQRERERQAAERDRFVQEVIEKMHLSQEERERQAAGRNGFVEEVLEKMRVSQEERDRRDEQRKETGGQAQQERERQEAAERELERRQAAENQDLGATAPEKDLNRSASVSRFLSPTWIEVVVAVFGILIVALILYWALVVSNRPY